MIHLRGVSIRSTDEEGFPFDVPALRGLELELDRPATLFVGENGSGKSTLLEALALATALIGVGSHSLDRDRSLDAVRPLAEAIRAVWNRRTHRGFFMRAEDFFGFVNRVKAEQAAFEREAARVRADNPGIGAPDLARMLGPQTGSRRELVERYGEDPDGRSHGEQFLAFFQARLVPGGLYLLDEPEVALSPTSQLAFLGLLIDAMRDRECQFVIATHSPILMALPDATILSFDDPPIRAIAYDEAEHVRLTRDFLEAPGRFLRHL
jgi:predicted ATPase